MFFFPENLKMLRSFSGRQDSAARHTARMALEQRPCPVTFWGDLGFVGRCNLGTLADTWKLGIDSKVSKELLDSEKRYPYLKVSEISIRHLD